MSIIGAGVIGVEYDSIFSVLDIELILVDGRDTLLEFLDREIVDEFIHYFSANGLHGASEEI
jgi:NAD(P) transhydrogenase